MANVKKIISHTETGKTVYAIITREVDGYLLNDVDGAFAAAPADPYLSLTEHATIKGRYSVSESRMAWNDGRYIVTVYKQAGGSPAPASDNVVGGGEIVIVSDAEVYAPDNAGIAAIKAKTDNLPDGVKKNTAYNNFAFFMVDSSDGKTAKTGLTITATRSIDGGAFASCANSASEIGSGFYKINLAASDLNGDTIAFLFTASGAIDRPITILTQT